MTSDSTLDEVEHDGNITKCDSEEHEEFLDAEQDGSDDSYAIRFQPDPEDEDEASLIKFMEDSADEFSSGFDNSMGHGNKIMPNISDTSFWIKEFGIHIVSCLMADLDAVSKGVCAQQVHQVMKATTGGWLDLTIIGDMLANCDAKYFHCRKHMDRVLDAYEELGFLKKSGDTVVSNKQVPLFIPNRDYSTPLRDIIDHLQTSADICRKKKDLRDQEKAKRYENPDNIKRYMTACNMLIELIVYVMNLNRSVDPVFLHQIGQQYEKMMTPEKCDGKLHIMHQKYAETLGLDKENPEAKAKDSDKTLNAWKRTTFKYLFGRSNICDSLAAKYFNKIKVIENNCASQMEKGSQGLRLALQYDVKDTLHVMWSTADIEKELVEARNLTAEKRTEKYNGGLQAASPFNYMTSARQNQKKKREQELEERAKTFVPLVLDADQEVPTTAKAPPKAVTPVQSPSTFISESCAKAATPEPREGSTVVQAAPTSVFRRRVDTTSNPASEKSVDVRSSSNGSIPRRKNISVESRPLGADSRGTSSLGQSPSFATSGTVESDKTSSDSDPEPDKRRVELSGKSRVREPSTESEAESEDQNKQQSDSSNADKDDWMNGEDDDSEDEQVYSDDDVKQSTVGSKHHVKTNRKDADPTKRSKVHTTRTERSSSESSDANIEIAAIYKQQHTSPTPRTANPWEETDRTNLNDKTKTSQKLSLNEAELPDNEARRSLNQTTQAEQPVRKSLPCRVMKSITDVDIRPNFRPQPKVAAPEHTEQQKKESILMREKTEQELQHACSQIRDNEIRRQREQREMEEMGVPSRTTTNPVRGRSAFEPLPDRRQLAASTLGQPNYVRSDYNRGTLPPTSSSNIDHLIDAQYSAILEQQARLRYDNYGPHTTPMKPDSCREEAPPQPYPGFARAPEPSSYMHECVPYDQGMTRTLPPPNHYHQPAQDYRYDQRYVGSSQWPQPSPQTSVADWHHPVRQSSVADCRQPYRQDQRHSQPLAPGYYSSQAEAPLPPYGPRQTPYSRMEHNSHYAEPVTDSRRSASTVAPSSASRLEDLKRWFVELLIRRMDEIGSNVLMWQDHAEVFALEANFRPAEHISPLWFHEIDDPRLSFTYVPPFGERPWNVTICSKR